MSLNWTQQDTSPKGNRLLTRIVAAGALAAALGLSGCAVGEGTTTLQADTFGVVAADTAVDDTATAAQFVADAVPDTAPEVTEENPAQEDAAVQAPAPTATPTPAAIPTAAVEQPDAADTTIAPTPTATATPTPSPPPAAPPANGNQNPNPDEGQNQVQDTDRNGNQNNGSQNNGDPDTGGEVDDQDQDNAPPPPPPVKNQETSFSANNLETGFLIDPGVNQVRVTVEESLLPGSMRLRLNCAGQDALISAELLANRTLISEPWCGDDFPVETSVATEYQFNITNDSDSQVALRVYWLSAEPPAAPAQPPVKNEGDGPNNPRPFTIGDFSSPGLIFDELSSATDPVDAFRVSADDPFFKTGSTTLSFGCSSDGVIKTHIGLYADGKLISEGNCITASSNAAPSVPDPNRPSLNNSGVILQLVPDDAKNIDIVFTILSEGRVSITGGAAFN